ncbi:hypothetical protein BKA56DRAFT_728191 [Ilyonectria sp. MPI-CAGE-AT-0026]|nr:hypothetical protein BKA56DRAFT_728191 [Ilyonectria sp. MPI-CAGE-AT-0026]
MAEPTSLISKLVSSVASVQNELQLAVATLNLDFTLVRLEAPKEYSGVATTLAEDRKENAESGSLHRTARKLGALFDGIPPSTPALLRAYGSRVSEICEKEKIDPLERARHGIFSRFVGVDSASIWAAATSGNNAIAVHLLACMIAEIFDAPQAVSLWMELIERRKADIEMTIGDETDQSRAIAKACAANQDISRPEVAAWDNSARAWLRTANEAKAVERRRALLETESVGAIVSNLPDMYESTIRAWKDAMSTMDRLIRGTPQRGSNGAVLLAMNSWHLFPNLCVLSRGPNIITQDDHLVVKTGILTIDFEMADDDSGGISWSVPLSYLRYYGRPIIVKQKLSLETSRVPVDQFRFVVLGCIFSTWLDFNSSADHAISWACMLLDVLRSPEPTNNKEQLALMRQIASPSSWIGYLLHAAEELQGAEPLEIETPLKLLRLGHRKRQFLCDVAHHPPPLFGLAQVNNLFSVLSGSETRIKYLREFAKDVGLERSSHIICYKHTQKVRNSTVSVWEFASIATFVGDVASRDSKGRVVPNALSVPDKPVRWIIVSSDSQRCQPSIHGCPCEVHRPTNCACWRAGGCSLYCHDWSKKEPCASLHQGVLRDRVQAITNAGELCFPACESFLALPGVRQVMFSPGDDFRDGLVAAAENPERAATVFLRFRYGDPETAFILERYDLVRGNNKPPYPANTTMPEKILATLFSSRAFDYTALASYLQNHHTEYQNTIAACANATEIFKCLPGMTISLSILERPQPLSQARWVNVPNMSERGRPSASSWLKSRIFSCLAMFESGSLDIDPSNLTNVFAMSSSNSIFVASSLLCDPYETTSEMEIQRVHGNIGQPGVSFLVPPLEPVVQKPDIGNWAVLNYAPFRGECEDNFSLTSIHLRLTEYELPLSGLQDNHLIDHPARILEAVAQVYDGPKWVADLDILGALKRIHCLQCKCKTLKAKSAYSEVFRGNSGVVSIDNWDEFLTEQTDNRIYAVRSFENWLARLATTCVGVQLGYKVSVLPRDICWHCVKSYVTNSHQVFIL